MDDLILVGKPAQVELAIEGQVATVISSATANVYLSTDAEDGTVNTCTVTAFANGAGAYISFGKTFSTAGSRRIIWNVTYSNGATETFVSTLEVYASPPANAIATYDPETTAGRVRRKLSDTDTRNWKWSDAEIADALSAQNDNVLLAAADLLEGYAVGLMMKTQDIKIGTLQVKRGGQNASADAMMKLAAQWRTEASGEVIVSGPDRIFTLTKDDGQTVGTTAVW